MVKLTTNFGDITLELNAEKAPITVANFLQYVESGFYDKVTGKLMEVDGVFYK